MITKATEWAMQRDIATKPPGMEVRKGTCKIEHQTSSFCQHLGSLTSPGTKDSNLPSIVPIFSTLESITRVVQISVLILASKSSMDTQRLGTQEAGWNAKL